MRQYLSEFTVRTRFLWIALSLATIVTFLFVACGGTPSTPTIQAQPSSTAKTLPSPRPSLTPIAVVHVKIIDLGETYAFDPETLNIKVGTQVVWTNDSHAVHTVTSDAQVFKIDDLAEQQTFNFIFTKPGTYPYYCNFHPGMQATINVT